MNLTALLDSMEYRSMGETEDKEIESLCYHSDEAKAGSIFFAAKGRDTDGRLYIKEAVKKGCSVIVAEEQEEPSFLNEIADRNVTVVTVKDVRLAMACMSARFYGNPSEELLVIGITGTKGKTSTCCMIWKILENAGVKTGIIGTVFTGSEGRLEESVNTTPQSVELQKNLRMMKDAGCKAVVMEVSSQGLMQKRTSFIDFDLGIFTNISPDHIGRGEHKDYEEYRRWKSELFKQCKVALLNGDDREAPFMEENSSAEKIFYYGRDKKADFSMEQISLWSENGSLGVKYNLKAPEFFKGESMVKGNLPGEFNAYNSAAAIAAVLILGIDREKAIRTVENIKIPGRAETVPVSDEFTVMVDYAHNGIALKSLLKSLRQYEHNRLIAVFGCGGDRDPSRRKEMGRAASELADIIIVTSDNPRSEDPLKIIEEIKSHIWEEKEVITIPDRREAIGKALETADKGDIIVIAGKGHETYQIIGEEVRHFDDREQILSFGKEKR